MEEKDEEKEEGDDECSDCCTKCRNWLILNLVVLGVVALIVWLVREFGGGGGGGGTSNGSGSGMPRSRGWSSWSSSGKSSGSGRTGGRRRIVSKLEAYNDSNVALENATMRINSSLFDGEINLNITANFELNNTRNLTRTEINTGNSNGTSHRENETSVNSMEYYSQINGTSTTSKINISDELHEVNTVSENKPTAFRTRG